MKKIIFFGAIILTALTAFSFRPHPVNNEIIITVSSDIPTIFDMNQDGKVLKGLSTPYKMTFNSNDSKLIFKSTSQNVGLKIKLTNNNAVLTANWKTVVLVIAPTGISTLGID